MYKLKYISLFTFLIFASGLYAQSDSANKNKEGEIVMTKEELKSFLKSVAEARLKKIEARKEMQDRLELAEAKAHYYEQLSKKQQSSDRYYSQRSYYQMPQQNANQVLGPDSQRDLLFEIERLNSKVDYLLSKINNDNPVSSTDSTVLVPVDSNNAVPNDNSSLSDDQVKIAELQRQLDYLQQKRNSTVEESKVMTADFDALNQRFDELNNRLQNATKEERRSALEELLKKFGNFKKQVFFANNSSKVSTSDVEYINDVVQVLKKNSELSIVLEGYASPVGNANYNKRLSMRRAEAVQSALESKGIPASRIVAAFKGEDHSGSEAHARRVDMSIIIK